MNNLLGQVITGIIVDKNEKNYFVQKRGVTFSLAKQEKAGLKLTDAVTGFTFVNQQQQKCLTTKIPASRQDHFGWGTVRKVRRDLGVFVDIGLPEKDIVVSKDDLPDLKELWPKVDDLLYLSLVVDQKARIWGKLAEEEIFKNQAKIADQKLQNQDICARVFRPKKVGTYVVTDDSYLGFIHPSECFKPLRLGEKVKARVIGIGKSGMLNLSLKPRAHEVINDDAAMILTFLTNTKEAKIPFTDTSTPEIIKSEFGISKGQFKRALGHLMKEKKVKQEAGFTVLCQES